MQFPDPAHHSFSPLLFHFPPLVLPELFSGQAPLGEASVQQQLGQRDFMHRLLARAVEDRLLCRTSKMLPRHRLSK